MSMIETFMPAFASLPRDAVARPKWKLNGRWCWRVTFFGKIVKRVEEQRERRDPDGSRFTEKRWRDMRPGDLRPAEDGRTDRELKRVIADLLEQPFPSSRSREAYGSLSKEQRLQLHQIADVNGSEAAERTLAAMVAQSTHHIPDDRDVEHLNVGAEVPADTRAAA